MEHKFFTKFTKITYLDWALEYNWWQRGQTLQWWNNSILNHIKLFYLFLLRRYLDPKCPNVTIWNFFFNCRGKTIRVFFWETNRRTLEREKPEMWNSKRRHEQIIRNYIHTNNPLRHFYEQFICIYERTWISIQWPHVVLRTIDFSISFAYFLRVLQTKIT